MSGISKTQKEWLQNLLWQMVYSQQKSQNSQNSEEAERPTRALTLAILCTQGNHSELRRPDKLIEILTKPFPSCSLNTEWVIQQTYRNLDQGVNTWTGLSQKALCQFPMENYKYRDFLVNLKKRSNETFCLCVEKHFKTSSVRYLTFYNFKLKWVCWFI